MHSTAGSWTHYALHLIKPSLYWLQHQILEKLKLNLQCYKKTIKQLTIHKWCMNLFVWIWFLDCTMNLFVWIDSYIEAWMFIVHSNNLFRLKDSYINVLYEHYKNILWMHGQTRKNSFVTVSFLVLCFCCQLVKQSGVKKVTIRHY